MVTAWQKRQTGPHGEKCFPCTSETLQNQCNTKTSLKGRKNKTLEEPSRTQLGLEFNPPVHVVGEASNPKAALSLALPFLPTPVGS